MTPEDKQLMQDLQDRLLALETTQNTDNNELVIDNLINRSSDVTDSDVTNAIGGEGGATFDFPDKWIEIKYKGGLLRLPAYLLNRT